MRIVVTGRTGKPAAVDKAKAENPGPHAHDFGQHLLLCYQLFHALRTLARAGHGRARRSAVVSYVAATPCVTISVRQFRTASSRPAIGGARNSVHPSGR